MPTIDYIFTDEEDDIEAEFEVSYETLPPEPGSLHFPRFPGGFEDVRFKLTRIRSIVLPRDSGPWIPAQDIPANVRQSWEDRLEGLYLANPWEQDRIDTAIAAQEDGRLESAMEDRWRR